MPHDILIQANQGKTSEMILSDASDCFPAEVSSDQGTRSIQQDSARISLLLPFNESSKAQIGSAMWTTLKILDKEFRGGEFYDYCGSTATVSLCYKGDIYTATLGDSYTLVAFLDADDNPLKVIPLNTLVHKPNKRYELQRIAMGELSKSITMPEDRKKYYRQLVDSPIPDKKALKLASPYVERGRLGGQLALSRRVGSGLYAASDALIDITSIDELMHQLDDPSQCTKIQIIASSDGFTDGASKGQSPEAFLFECLENWDKKMPLSHHLVEEGMAGFKRRYRGDTCDNTTVAVQTIFDKEKALIEPCLIAVFDGHGFKGEELSSQLAKLFPEILDVQIRLPAPIYCEQEFSVQKHKTIIRRDHVGKPFYKYLLQDMVPREVQENLRKVLKRKGMDGDCHFFTCLGVLDSFLAEDCDVYAQEFLEDTVHALQHFSYKYENYPERFTAKRIQAKLIKRLADQRFEEAEESEAGVGPSSNPSYDEAYDTTNVNRTFIRVIPDKSTGAEEDEDAPRLTPF